MPGTFSKTNRPRRPGAYFAFEAIQALPPPPGLAGIVAVAFTSDWGPSETATLLRSFADYSAVFGSSTNTQGYRSVRQAFQGEGTPGDGGASAVLAFRMSGAAAAKATHVYQNTTPAAAITVNAIYEGSRGNNLNVTIQAAASPAGTHEFLLYDGATLIEKFSYVSTDIVGLVAQINTNSHFITATMTVGGIALAFVANVSLTGGNDGATLIAADYTQMMSALEVERFAVLTNEFPADNTILTSLKVWAQGLRANGKMFRTVVGGALNESSATAITRAQLFNDEGFIVIGQGSVVDPVLGQLSTSQLAPRLAGIVAARGESKGLSFARFAGLTNLIGPTQFEILAAFDAGLVVLARDSNTTAPIRIEKGITTYTTTTNTAKPYSIYRDPKFVATMDAIQMEATSFNEDNVIGQMQVNGSTRGFVRGQLSTMLKTREDLGIVQPGWTVVDDFNPPATPQDDFMQFRIGLNFGRSAEQVYITASVG